MSPKIKYLILYSYGYPWRTDERGGFIWNGVALKP